MLKFNLNLNFKHEIIVVEGNEKDEISIYQAFTIIN